MESVENVRIVISRITRYICNCENNFELADVNVYIIHYYIIIYFFLFGMVLSIMSDSNSGVETERYVNI